ncbi:hypothetical protein [Streptomyces sp. NPDC004629]|uniref:hypothetical protein n=1 Tax=Streptomyces sp. NPDC004629 TaxID=3364705 RepID=UPI0036C47621
MAGQRRGEPAEGGAPVPRDLPDQQAGAGNDRWEAAPRNPADTDDDVDDVPDTDEAGTGRGDTPFSGTVHPEHPVPEEPSD